MKITRGIVGREEALRLAPEYVKFLEKPDSMDVLAFLDGFNKLKKGQAVITFAEGVFVRAKVSTVKEDFRLNEDGPVVRVSNGEFSWRVDGDKFAHRI